MGGVPGFRMDPSEPDPPWEPMHAQPGDPITAEPSGWSVGSAHAQTFRWDQAEDEGFDDEDWAAEPSDRLAIVAVLAMAAVAVVSIIKGGRA